MSLNRRITVCVATIVVAIASSVSLKAAEKSKTIEVGDLELEVPSSWEKEQPKSRLRLAQFKLPAAKGDKETGEVAVFSFGSSSLEANIKRWIGQFEADGRNAKVTSGEAKQGKYIFVDISGTYKKPDGPPFAMKTISTKGMRVINVALVAKEKLYFFKLVGMDKTTAMHADGFRKSFGGDASKEKELKLED